jgi:hypothetical protein
MTYAKLFVTGYFSYEFTFRSFHFWGWLCPLIAIVVSNPLVCMQMSGPNHPNRPVDHTSNYFYGMPTPMVRVLASLVWDGNTGLSVVSLLTVDEQGLNPPKPPVPVAPTLVAVPVPSYAHVRTASEPFQRTTPRSAAFTASSTAQPLPSAAPTLPSKLFVRRPAHSQYCARAFA